MKIQCSVCEVAEAAVFCCADEAALCSLCDRNVHAANKLASKHERIPLANSSSQMPYCDICQEMVGYFFCLEDRALMCRKCDVAIHTANSNTSSHRRFLLSGVRIGLEPSEPSPSSSVDKSLSAQKVSVINTHSASKTSAPASLPSLYDNVMPVKRKVGNLTPAKRSAPLPLSEEYTEAPADRQWLTDESDRLNELSLVFGFTDQRSAKFANQADGRKLGNSVSSSIARASEDNLNLDDCFSQEPDVTWSVPQVPPLTSTSGLNCPKTTNESMENSAFVPDIY